MPLFWHCCNLLRFYKGKKNNFLNETNIIFFFLLVNRCIVHVFPHLLTSMNVYHRNVTWDNTADKVTSSSYLIHQKHAQSQKSNDNLGVLLFNNSYTNFDLVIIICQYNLWPFCQKFKYTHGHSPKKCKRSISRNTLPRS